MPAKPTKEGAALCEEILKLEADDRGVWISALKDGFSQAEALAFLRKNGVRKYDARLLEEFLREKSRTPFRIAPRDPLQEKEGRVLIRLARDNMYATATLEAPFFTKPWPTERDVRDALSQKGVVFGIDDSAIAALVADRPLDDSTVVAQGTPPRDGQHARIELLVDPERPPEVAEDERVDHWSRSTLVSVLKGQEIAVKHPAVPGVDGTTVIGSPIRTAAVKDVSFPAGDGLETAEGNELSLVAAVDGQLAWKNRKLTVVPEIEISGDVDFGVGSIDFTGTVRIKGAVREGFHVVSSGDIEINEMVEGARVESQSDIVIHGGVRGMSKGMIRAAGDVTLGFADQATIRSGGTVSVKNALLHSQVTAQRAVIVMGGPKAQIAGGRVEAGVEVSCQILGSEMGTRTEIVVGIPPEQLERRRLLQADVAQNNDNLTKLEANIVFLKKLEAAGQLDDQKRAMLLSATKMKFQIQAALKPMTEELKALEEGIESFRVKGVVRARDVCYPGVQISLRGVSYVVREACRFSSFVVENGSVVLKPFDYQP
ncbi:MAG: FapA family protein [Fretibacterium sp.]|nr:FapA family protein [Fretibacterium sp.]